jgi:hypothetical protein
VPTFPVFDLAKSALENAINSVVLNFEVVYLALIAV